MFQLFPNVIDGDLKHGILLSPSSDPSFLLRDPPLRWNALKASLSPYPFVLGEPSYFPTTPGQHMDLSWRLTATEIENRKGREISFPKTSLIESTSSSSSSSSSRIFHSFLPPSSPRLQLTKTSFSRSEPKRICADGAENMLYSGLSFYLVNDTYHDNKRRQRPSLRWK